MLRVRMSWLDAPPNWDFVLRVGLQQPHWIDP
jgi:hypothetical protein